MNVGASIIADSMSSYMRPMPSIATCPIDMS
jgi:hypothetical protein